VRKPFIAGNWKMNTDSSSSVQLATDVVGSTSGLAGASVDVAVIPPFVYLKSVFDAVKNSSVSLGAQDIYFQEKGAFTGEISAAMLKDVGCTYVLCGHSERRHVIKENDGLINKKLNASISGGLLPILCVGELLEERKAEQTIEVITRQIKAGLEGLGREKFSAVTIAYEPVWAIGTGLTATPDQAQQVHALIRELIADLYDSEAAKEVRILYGGSVKPGNTAELMSREDLDGLLVGGASLKAQDFGSIIEAAV
jgi:triosephosphate isomerase